jgi:hypothetical protein
MTLTSAVSRTFSTTSAPGAARTRESAREPADHVLVALERNRAGGEQHADEAERDCERVALQLAAEQVRAPGTYHLVQLDGMRGGRERALGRAERERRLGREVLDVRERLVPRIVRRERAAHLLDLRHGVLQAEHGHRAPEELRAAAVHERAQVGDVRLQQDALEP